MSTLDPKLEEYATPLQWERLKAVEQYGSQRSAANALGVSRSLFSSAKAAVEKRAAQHGYAPDHDMIHTAPDGYRVKGTSTLYDAQTGDARIQWVKTQVDDERAAEARDMVLAAMLEDIPAPEPVTLPLTRTPTGLLNQYTITDFHLGMVAWGEECGEDFDTKIAEKLLIDWFRAAIKQSPDADVGLLAQMGDFLHWDGLDAVTPASKHLLDADTRFQNVVRVAVRVIRQIINMMREKYPRVHIIMADANHDPASGVWLREMLAAMYDGDEHVTVDTSPSTYYCYEWGRTALFYHHGHKKPMKGLSMVLVAKFKEIWGRCNHAYAHTGHLHSDRVVEDNLMTTEQHQTLAAKDSWTARMGYDSGRSAKVISYDKEYGEVGRVTLTPEMVLR